MTRGIYLVLILVGWFCQAQQTGRGAWLNVDYTYTDLTYKQELMIENGRLAGVRGDLGFDLASFMGIGVGGSYQDGNLGHKGTTLTGTTLNGLTKDYIRETHALLHLYYGQAVISAGMAEREWYNDLVASNRRRTTYKYYPVSLTFHRRMLYVKAETLIWAKGKNKSYMSDVSALQKDVEFTQDSGSGYGVELGLLIPTAMGARTRIYVAYQRWEVKDSDTQFDGVYYLKEPKNNTTILQAGIGLSF